MSTINIDPKIKIKKIEELIDLPVVLTVNKFNEEVAKSFRDTFAKALNTGQKIVPIVIDSYGGEVYSLLSMVAVIKSSPLPVATIVSGKAMSCGAILLSCGTEGYRFADPSATIMIHEVSVGSFGKVEEVKVDAKEAERLNQLIFKLMARNAGKDEDFFLKVVHENNHADLFLNAEDCKKFNLVNHIRIPSFKIKISSEISFD